MDEEELFSPIELENYNDPEEELDGLDTVTLATVTEIGTNGVKLKLDGEESAGDKYYKVNRDIRLAINDRVKVHKNSGTYLVEYTFGSPMSRYPIPSGGNAGQYLVKASNDSYDLTWGNAPTVSSLTYGANAVTFSGSSLYPTGVSTSLGTSSHYFVDCYIRGKIKLGDGRNGETIGFFGKTPTTKQTVGSSGTLAKLISALQAYGLIA